MSNNEIREEPRDEVRHEQVPGQHASTSPLMVVLAWALVAMPLLYGLWQAVIKASKLFA